jgi:mannose-6-phosphate isomerase-like protein (cupin superfamily)
MIRELKADFSHTDERGSLFQLTHEAPEQVNVLISKKGTSRGNHYHKISTESFFVVSGSVEVTCSKENETEVRCFHSGDYFQIPPYTAHSMRFAEDCVMVAMYDICIEKENGEKDIWG